MTSLLILTILVALVFEFTNSFHDSSNAISTVVYTKALTRKQALIMASVLNFAGALTSSHVAKTISSGLLNISIPQTVIISALVGAISWNLITWYFKMPSSSSHALFGGLIGTSIAYAGIESLNINGIVSKILIPLVTSPVIGFVVALIGVKLLSKLPESTNKYFRWIQVVSASFVSFSHGISDSQKTTGIVTLSLISAGILTKGSEVPIWVMVISAIVMGVGTSFGGSRIMETLGKNISDLTTKSGTVAETTSGVIMQIASWLGCGISTTHIISSAIIGTGVASKEGMVEKGWKTVNNMLLTWLITIPITAVIGALIYNIIK